MWQVQLCGDNKGAFAFRVLTVAKDALQEHPDTRVRTLRDLETVLQVRLIVGSPAQAGPSDPDEVGFVDWQVVLYSTSLPAALAFIHFILDYKAQKGYASRVPDLAVHAVDADVGALPDPWILLADSSFIPPKPFSVLPPKGRRHVILQLEQSKEGKPGVQSEEEDEADEKEEMTYLLTFYGGIYHFKDRFEDLGVPGALVAINASEQKDYVRYLEIKLDPQSQDQVLMVLDCVLKGIPLYFVNMLGDADPMALWLQEQPSVFQAEEAS